MARAPNTVDAFNFVWRELDSEWQLLEVCRRYQTGLCNSSRRARRHACLRCGNDGHGFQGCDVRSPHRPYGQEVRGPGGERAERR